MCSENYSSWITLTFKSNVNQNQVKWLKIHTKAVLCGNWLSADRCVLHTVQNSFSWHFDHSLPPSQASIPPLHSIERTIKISPILQNFTLDSNFDQISRAYTIMTTKLNLIISSICVSRINWSKEIRWQNPAKQYNLVIGRSFGFLFYFIKIKFFMKFTY